MDDWRKVVEAAWKIIRQDERMKEQNPTPPERVKIAEPVPLKVIITTRRGNKEVAWTTEEDFEKFKANAESWIGVTVWTTQASGKGKGRTRKKVYKYAKDVEKG